MALIWISGCIVRFVVVVFVAFFSKKYCCFCFIHLHCRISRKYLLYLFAFSSLSFFSIYEKIQNFNYIFSQLFFFLIFDYFFQLNFSSLIYFLFVNNDNCWLNGSWVGVSGRSGDDWCGLNSSWVLLLRRAKAMGIGSVLVWWAGSDLDWRSIESSCLAPFELQLSYSFA